MDPVEAALWEKSPPFVCWGCGRRVYWVWSYSAAKMVPRDPDGTLHDGGTFCHWRPEDNPDRALSPRLKQAIRAISRTRETPSPSAGLSAGGSRP